MNPDGPPPRPPSSATPIPLHGGVMHFKVLFRAAKALQAQGAAVLRFNFRGVGRSEGMHDDGRGEQDDARAALDEMARRFPGLPMVLGGFSFGSVDGAARRLRAMRACARCSSWASPRRCWTDPRSSRRARSRGCSCRASTTIRDGAHPRARRRRCPSRRRWW